MTDTRVNIKSQLRHPVTGKLIANGATDTLAITTALDNTLRRVRANHIDLPKIVLVVGAEGRIGRDRAHGVFEARAWAAKPAKGKPAVARIHEIMMAGESFARGPEATLGTLLHECAHALAVARGIQDTSRNGRYHNKRFKALAEEIGIEVENVPPMGWSITTLPKATARKYAPELSELRKALKSYRVPQYDGEPKPRVSHMIWTHCDCRELRVPKAFWADGSISCDVCGVTFAEGRLEADSYEQI